MDITPYAQKFGASYGSIISVRGGRAENASKRALIKLKKMGFEPIESVQGAYQSRIVTTDSFFQAPDGTIAKISLSWGSTKDSNRFSLSFSN